MPRSLVMFIYKQRCLAPTVHEVAMDTAKLISDVSRPVVVLGGTAVDDTSVKVLAGSTSRHGSQAHAGPSNYPQDSLQTTSSLGPQSRVPQEDTNDDSEEPYGHSYPSSSTQPRHEISRDINAFIITSHGPGGGTGSGDHF
ncbi:hypothetical protein JB92DRAFT_3121406 [Gautieria morchelliformis]|nr:hypothetical protein JB92DRAFT_3121406 [Gautieria morchelliformis]